MSIHSEEFEELVPESDDGTGPFSVGAIDPLVYTMDDTSPELRAAASYIPVAPKLTIRDAAPVPPQHRQHEAWTPGGDVEPAMLKPAGPSVATRLARSTITLLVVAIPLVVVAGIVWMAYSLYS